MTKKAGAIVQIVIVSLLILFGTVGLFMGNFAAMYATFPVLLVYYVFIVARQKRKRTPEEDDETGR